MLTKEQRLKGLIRKELYQKAQDGDKETLNHFTKEWGLKVYTNEEIGIITLLLKRKKMDQDEKQDEKQDIKNQEKVVELPSLDGSLKPALINWIEDIGDGHFRVGLTYLGHYPYNGGSTEWVLKLDPELGFKPLFCSFYWEEDC